MKKRYPFFIALLLPSILLAQPVILQSSLPATSINLQMFAVTNSGSSDPLPNGADITWDLSSAQLQMLGMAFLGPAAGTPHAATYPSANLALTQDFFGLQQAYTYHEVTSSGIDLLAEVAPGGTTNYINPKQVMKFPFNYNGTFMDTYQKEGNSPVNVTWNYSGYGTVISTLGTVTGIVKTVSTEGDIVFWNAQPLHPFIIINSSGIFILANGQVGITELNDAQVIAFPNPANDALLIRGHSAGDNYTIHDAVGRLISDGRIPSVLDHTLDLGGYAQGRYTLRIWNMHRSTVLPVIKG